MIKKTFFSLFLALVSFQAFSIEFEPYFPFCNRSYVVYRAPEPVQIDGDIYTPEWEKAAWTEDFVDIQGMRRDVEPKYRTRAKMLWDNNFLYIAVELEEPHIWGTVKDRDAVIFWDNDIEFFIDPSCCGKNYREFEFNTLNTQWDLLLTMPQHRLGLAVNDWDAKGLKTAVKCYGTLNDPSDRDEKWTFEAAVPIASVGGSARPGTQWRMTLSRVEWLSISTRGGKYSKLAGCDWFGSEENWLWAPTGAIDAHRPERWGWIQFAEPVVGQGTEEFNWNNGHEYVEALWTVSNRIRQYRFLKGKNPEKFEDLELDNPMDIKYVRINDTEYHVSVTSDMGVTYSTMNSGVLEKSMARPGRRPGPGRPGPGRPDPDRFKDRVPGVNPYAPLMADKAPSAHYHLDTILALRSLF